MPIPMSNLFGGQMPPGATVQPAAPGGAPSPQPGMPMPGPMGQPGGNDAQSFAQLLAFLIEHFPGFAQAVAQERARRQMAGPQGPSSPPMPGMQPSPGAPAPQPGGGGSRFAEALQQLRRR